MDFAEVWAASDDERPWGRGRSILMVLTEIRGIYRLGDDIVNVYLIEELGLVTIVDAGMPGYYGLIPDALAEMGRSLADVRAILLTHGHSDHIGFAEQARREHSWPVPFTSWTPRSLVARSRIRPRARARLLDRSDPRLPVVVAAARCAAPAAPW